MKSEENYLTGEITSEIRERGGGKKENWEEADRERKKPLYLTASGGQGLQVTEDFTEVV